MWTVWQPQSEREHPKALEKYAQSKAAYDEAVKQAIDNRRAPSNKLKEPEKPFQCMLCGEDTTFLKLACALRLLLARSVADNDISRGKQLLFDYLREYRDVSEKFLGIESVN